MFLIFAEKTVKFKFWIDCTFTWLIFKFCLFLRAFTFFGNKSFILADKEFYGERLQIVYAKYTDIATSMDVSVTQVSKRFRY